MKIIQIMPIANWYAVYEIDDGNGPIATLLAFAAIVEDPDGPPKVVGFSGGDKFTRADTQDNFIGYIHENELQNMMVEEVEE